MGRAWENKKAKTRDPLTNLNKRQTVVIDLYFGRANFDKTKALRMAGYSCPNDYTQFFNHPDVEREVERRWAEVRARYDVTYDRVVTEIAKVAFANVGSYVQVQDDGSFVLDFENMDMTEWSAIGEVSVETYVEGRGDNAREVKRIRVKPWNKLAALDQLMRHAGLSKDKTSSALADLASRITAGMKRVGKEDE